ncbi:MAG: hypothetical protein BJ554DRAFT_1202, partial [Olpidium bornovanus]
SEGARELRRSTREREAEENFRGAQRGRERPNRRTGEEMTAPRTPACAPHTLAFLLRCLVTRRGSPPLAAAGGARRRWHRRAHARGTDPRRGVGEVRTGRSAREGGGPGGAARALGVWSSSSLPPPPPPASSRGWAQNGAAVAARFAWSPEEARESVLRAVNRQATVQPPAGPGAKGRAVAAAAAWGAAPAVEAEEARALEAAVERGARAVQTPAELTGLAKWYLSRDLSPPASVRRLLFAAAARLAEDAGCRASPRSPHRADPARAPFCRGDRGPRADGGGLTRARTGHAAFTTAEAYGFAAQLKRRLRATADDWDWQACASSYRSFLRVLVADRRGAEALEVLSEMRLNGLVPGVASLRLAMRAVARQKCFHPDGRDKMPDVDKCVALIADAVETMHAFPSNGSIAAPWIKAGVRVLIGLDIAKWLAIGWAAGIPPLIGSAMTVGAITAGIYCWRWTDAAFRTGTPKIMEIEVDRYEDKICSLFSSAYRTPTPTGP